MDSYCIVIYHYVGPLIYNIYPNNIKEMNIVIQELSRKQSKRCLSQIFKISCWPCWKTWRSTSSHLLP